MMKSDAEQVMQLNAAQVWAGESTGRSQRPEPAKFKLLTLRSKLALTVLIGLSLWIYFSGMLGEHFLTAHIADNAGGNSGSEFEQQAKHWALVLTLSAVANGLGLFAISFFDARSIRRRWLQSSARNQEQADQSDLRVHKLLSQLADAKVSQEENNLARFELTRQLRDLTQRHTTLEQELDQRRETEKNLSQQTQILERSKDALEKHIQTRTQEMQKLQRRYELILESAGEGICGFDLQGHAIFVNPTAAKFTGWKVEELVGKSEEAIFFPPKARNAKEAPGFLRSEKGDCLPEQILYRRDGSNFPAEYVRTFIRENDLVVGTVVMFKDITERRLAEDKLNHKAVELARSNRELEQFAFVASHDLQEPLRKIQAFGDRLKVKCEAAQLTEGKDFLERMQSAAARMQILINDLLTFSRIITSSQAFVPVDLGAVTREVLVDLEHRIEKTAAQVQVSRLPAIQADPTQIRQLLQNLIGNALKFQAPGALPVVKVEAQVISRYEIQPDAVLSNPSPADSPDDQFCLLTVQDNGIGFEEQYLEKVFAVFQRLHGRSEYEGTGVGLAVCRRITDRHGGFITAQSKLGEGAKFIVILPMKQPAPEEPR
jgi:two-component system sensor kinase FixL